ncbi:hypothetical protein JK386_02520 [Nocardioides sp. zg-536]|uniref:Uncharacterized protein n=1 Tax=Nocardioides faecalis TaxID=2803858 RepID=A0A938Y6H2_9ACTN|nr:hypothetical protein [Nocardioides faecalis]MBM9458760.1 hypothetical protein [Nocardioides faecalis]QVI60178.1 hypothetical protein KG111_07780 [Nocardioides faecalis]
MARLYRPDCPVEFIAASDFKRRVLSDPTWPKACAMRFLAARPSAWDLECLAKRGDVPVEMLVEAAKKGYRSTSPGLARARYLQLSFMPGQTLREMSAGQDVELRAALRNPACPEEVVVRCLTSPLASIRWSALRAVQQRNLPISSVYIRAAMELPMTESGLGGPPKGYRFRVITTAKQILAGR